MKFKFLLLTLFASFLSLAQTTGIISGVLKDKNANNQPLAFANVLLKNTAISANSDIDGKYLIKATPGDYTIVFSFIGYENVEVPVTVVAGQTVIINKTIGSGNYTLQDVVVKSTNVNREKETAILMDQKKSIEIKQSIGIQEMSRKGISDVASAVAKTTGVTKQEGTGNIFVRGLGDRYNSTTINGLPVPSNDPEKKNINLDIFSTDIVEYVSIDKVYSSRIYGDFAGGNVDIVSKDYNGKGFLKLETGAKLNTNALRDNDFSFQKGNDKFGFSNQSIPNNPLTEFNYNTFQSENLKQIAESYGVSGGKSFNVGKEGKFKVFGTFSFSNDFQRRTEGTLKGSVNGAGVANELFENYNSLNYNTSTTAMGNLGYKFNKNNKINFNTIFINTSTFNKSEYSGYVVDVADEGNGFIRRTTYTKNTLKINQLLGEHIFSDRLKYNWSFSYNTVQGDIPNRTLNTFRNEPNGFVFAGSSVGSNNRYFQKLTEKEISGNMSIDYKFLKKEDNSFNGKLTLGLSGRDKVKDFEAIQFNFKTANAFLATIVDPNNLDLFYNQPNLSKSYFNIITFRGDFQVDTALNPQTYNGKQQVFAAYTNAEFKVNKLAIVIGLRGENVIQKIAWNTQLQPDGGKSKFDKLKYLPSFIMRYELNEKQNLRLGASKTYTLPQFKEVAPFSYEDEENNEKFGNPDLYASDDYNLDLKWEFFPKSEELISLTTFGKYILNPINEVTVLSSTNDISYLNTGDSGYVIGAEIEYRKLLFYSGDANSRKLSIGLNASYLKSEQELDNEKIKKETLLQADFTDQKSGFTGASDLLLNADLSFNKEWKNKDASVGSTIAYSYFSDRIYSIGTSDRGNLIDKAFGTLDFITRAKINKNFGANLIIKNILNPTIDRIQDNESKQINVLSYKKGLNFNFSFTYQF